MVLMQFSIFPLDKGESVGAYVARVARIIDESGLSYRLHAMGTVVEGELDQCLALLRRCFEELEKDCNRIICNVYFDERKGYGGRLRGKVESVEKHLGRSLRGADRGPEV